MGLTLHPQEDSDIYANKYLEIIKKWYKYYEKYDDKQQYKAIIEAAILSTPNGLTYNTPITLITLVNMKKSIAIKSLSPFLALLDVKKYMSTD